MLAWAGRVSGLTAKLVAVTRVGVQRGNGRLVESTGLPSAATDGVIKGSAAPARNRKNHAVIKPRGVRPWRWPVLP